MRPQVPSIKSKIRMLPAVWRGEGIYNILGWMTKIRKFHLCRRIQRKHLHTPETKAYANSLRKCCRHIFSILPTPPQPCEKSRVRIIFATLLYRHLPFSCQTKNRRSKSWRNAWKMAQSYVTDGGKWSVELIPRTLDFMSFIWLR